MKLETVRLITSAGMWWPDMNILISCPPSRASESEKLRAVRQTAANTPAILSAEGAYWSLAQAQ